MSGSDKRPIGRRIAGPVALVMLIAFFAATVSEEVMDAVLRNADITGVMGDHRYLGLKYFEYLCELMFLGSLIWLGTYHFLVRRWRLLSALAVILGLLTSSEYAWHLLSIRSVGLHMIEVSGKTPKVDMGKFKSLLLEDTKTSLEERSKVSISVAKDQYFDTGEPQSFLDTDGKFKPYVPTPDETYRRKRLEVSVASFQYLAPQLLAVALAHIGLAFVALVAGFITARMDRKVVSA